MNAHRQTAPVVVDEQTYFLVFANFRWVHCSQDAATALQVYWRMNVATIGAEFWLAENDQAAEALKQTGEDAPARTAGAQRLRDGAIQALALEVFA